MRKPSFLMRALFTAGSILLLAGVAYPQADDSDEPPPPADTTFLEISLTNDGVIAVDVGGYDWYYDFELGTFVMGPPPDDLRPDLIDRSEALTADEFPVEERCTEERHVKAMARSVLVGYDEFVDGDIVALGRVTIKGWVKGDVRSYNQRVLVASSGQVDGDIYAPDVIVRDGGVVIGEIVEASGPLEFDRITRTFSVNGLILVLSFTIFFLLAGFLAVTLMPNKLANFQQCFRTHAVKSWVVGFLSLLLMPIVMALVAITIVGAVLLPIIPFVYLAAILLGVTSFGTQLGGIISKQLQSGNRGSVAQFFLGLVALMSLWFLVAILMGSSSSVSEGFGILFLVIAIIVSTYPVCSGIGSAVLTRFGFRSYTSWKERHLREGGAPAPAPPPIPTAPPIAPGGDMPPGPDETSAAPPRNSE